MESPSQPVHRRRRRGRGGRPASEGTLYQESRAHLLAVAGFANSGFEGANYSSRRGWIFWPTLETARELDTYSREEMVKKSRWLRANFGIANRICSGLSDMIGFLTPLSLSGDETWDRLCDDHWNWRTCEPSLVTASGDFEISGLQIELNKAAFGDGDVLPVLLREPDGLRLVTYDSPQVRSPQDAPPGWIDGVKLDKFQRHLAYGVARADGTVSQVAANDAIYYRHPDTLNRVRPPTALKHAINHLVDIAEILADTKLTIKVAAQLGLYLKNQAANSGGFQGPRAIAGGLRNEQLPDSPDGTPTEKSLQVEDFYRSVGGVANLPAGSDIGTIQDTRPHPNQITLLDYLVRDVAWGVGVSPEIIWSIEKLGGANVRVISADLERWIAVRLLRQRNWLRRFRAVWVANEIRAGRLPEPPGSAKFWRCTMLPQASLTADAGRVGALNIELVKNRMRSLATHFAEEGRDWQTELRQIAKERAELRALGLALTDATPPPATP